MSPQAQDDTYGNPLFVDTTDFVLQSGSPAIDAGEAWTTVSSQAGTCTAGSAATIKVANADYFHGPWGNDGGAGGGSSIIPGDTIRIKGVSTDQTRTISSVAWAADGATNRIGTITVTSPLTCQTGDGVAIAQYWKGSKPDIGAKEYETAGTTLTGDLNADGKVNITDIQLCVKVILKTETDPGIVSRADVNGDGSVNIKDIQEIVRIIISGGG